MGAIPATAVAQAKKAASPDWAADAEFIPGSDDEGGGRCGRRGLTAVYGVIMMTALWSAMNCFIEASGF